MKNKLVLNMCIADINDLIEMAVRDYVLKEDGYTVSEVFWDDRAMTFRVTLEPAKVEKVV